MLPSTPRLVRSALAIPALLATLCALPARAQSVNLRVTTIKPVPSPSYGAATGQAGVWNSVVHTYWSQNGPPTSLVDLSGAPTAATAITTGCDAETCSVAGYGPDVDALFGAFVNGDCYADPSITSISGLAPGHYVLTVYPSACQPGLHTIYVNLGDQSFSANQTIGGSYNGSFAQMTLGVFGFVLPPGVSVAVRPNNYGAMSALQFTRYDPPVAYCTSKVNSEGCQALIGASGGLAASLTEPSAFYLEASGVVTNTLGIFFYGFGRDIKPFKGGFHCVKTPTPRTPGQFSATLGVPCSGMFAFDFNQYLQGPGVPVVIAPGMALDGQYWYRDANDPQGFFSATSDAIEFYVVP